MIFCVLFASRQKVQAHNAAGNNYLTAQYNGNISGQSWRSAGDKTIRQYRYSYDAANRLLKADFVQNAGGWGKSFNFDSQMGDGQNPGTAYDLNGNILSMKQWGWTVGNANTQIDQLTYTYQHNGLSNRLRAVADAMAAQAGLGDFTNNNTTADDYGYDPNGNLVTDLNKKMMGATGSNLTATTNAIAYNHLNLPTLVKVKKADGSTDKGTIAYSYDATGTKLTKTVTELNATVPYNGTNYTSHITTTTTYLSGLVYESKAYSHAALAPLQYTDRLQYAAHEEGRIRALYGSSTHPDSITGFVYDYMLKDHLGNVRMVLTDEVKTNFYPAATLETATIAAESNIYSNLTATQTSKPGWFSDPLYPTNNMVARLRNAGGYQKVGPNILLKVMAGDKFNIRVASGWSGTSPTNSQASVYADLFSSVTIGLAAHSAGKATAAALQSPAVGIGSALTTFLNSQPAATNTPKAYLAWLLFDEQFKLVSTGAQQVGASGATTLHVVNGQLVTKSGYLYVYTSNEATNMDVFFDNLQVTHIQGALLEETHYYPFGLVMSGISSKAAGLIQNKEKTFQGQRFDDDLGLNWVQFKWRNHDPQIGRFIEIDPLSEKYVYNSTYAFSENKVTGHVELEGLEAAPTEDKRPYPARVPAANTIGNVAKGFVFGLNGQYQTEPVRGSTVTGIRDTKAGGTNAAGKTKGMDVVRVDEPHGKVTTPHLNINPKATGLPSDPHTPLTPTQFNGLKTAGQVLDGIDRIAKPVAIVTDAIQLGNAIKTDIQQGTGGDNTIVTGSRVAGGWAGAWGGAQGGAAIGAGIGSFFGPGPFTAVGGFIGGIIGGIGGAIFGSKVGEAAGEKVVEIKNGN